MVINERDELLAELADVWTQLNEECAAAARLRSVLRGKPMIKALHFDEGAPWEVVVFEHSIVKALGAEAAMMVDKWDGENFLTVYMQSPDGQGFEMTIRRAGKKTPAQVIGELRSEIDRLTRERDACRLRRKETIDAAVKTRRLAAVAHFDAMTLRESVAALTRERDEAKAHARLAFVEGCAWWEFHRDGATIWPSDRDIAEAEVERRYPGTGWPTHGECVREAERELDELRAELAPVRAVRAKYEHMDEMLSNSRWYGYHGWRDAYDLWMAIRRKP